MPAEMPARDLSLAWELTLGTVRFRKRLDFIIKSFIKAPLRNQKPGILAALRLGIYQLSELSGVPEFAAVDETVSLTAKQFSKREAGFINAVLRSYIREPNKVVFPDRHTDAAGFLSNYYSYPDWLVRRWLGRLGLEETEDLFKAMNLRPKANFKILESKIEVNDLIKRLTADGLETEKGRYLPDFISSPGAQPIIKSGSFADGLINVQDESQGLAALLLDPPPGSTVLDLCSAPGGKSIALADRIGPGSRVVSVEIDSERIKEIEENISRTGFKIIEIIRQDLLQYEPGEKFRYILLDVPCSGLGTISSNPDLRWAKKESDIINLSRIQLEMLKKASTWLADDGVLIYSTCTTEPDEIEEVIAGFLKINPDFWLEDGNSPVLRPFKSNTGIYRSWPHKHAIGGAGFARLRNKT